MVKLLQGTGFCILLREKYFVFNALYSDPNTAAFSEKRFDDWKHPETVHQHEKCSGHFESIKVFELWEMKNGLVDSEQLLLPSTGRTLLGGS